MRCQLPAGFDEIGATLENAARLHAAGVQVSFSQAGDASHNARKVRQLAGNAVAHGLPWEAGLAGLSAVPAASFGLGAELGSIAVGQRADLVLWSGDPLDVAHVAHQVWLDGRRDPDALAPYRPARRYIAAAQTCRARSERRALTRRANGLATPAHGVSWRPGMGPG